MGFLCCLIPGEEGGDRPRNQPGPSLSWKCCQEGEIQSSLSQEGFALLEGGKRRVLKGDQGPLCQRSGLSQSGQPGDLQRSLHCSSAPSCSAKPWCAAGSAWCGLKQLLAPCPLQRQVLVWARGALSAVSLQCSCQPSWELALASWDSNTKGKVREKQSRPKTEAKCLFGHYPSPLSAEIFPPAAASQLGSRSSPVLQSALVGCSTACSPGPGTAGLPAPGRSGLQECWCHEEAVPAGGAASGPGSSLKP